MTTYRNVEIHAVGRDGVSCRVNAFRGDNDSIRASSPEDQMTRRDDLVRRAQHCAQAWRRVLLDEEVNVVDVRDPRVFERRRRS